MAYQNGVITKELSEKSYALSQESFEHQKTIERSQMIRNLSDKFDSGPIYQKLSADIAACRPLKIDYSDPSSDTLSIYLNFFETLSFMKEQNIIDLQLIDWFFGAYIVVAFQHPHVKRHIQFHHDNNQPRAWDDLDKISQEIIKGSQDRKDLADFYRKQCRKELRGQ